MPKKVAKRSGLNPVSVLWIFIGLFIMAVSLVKAQISTLPEIPTPEPFELPKAHGAGDIPIKVAIADLIDLPLVPVALNLGNWIVDPDLPSYLTDSARMGEKGNLIIYGHNLPLIFGRLTKVQLGDTITLYSETNSKTYQVTDKVVVNPNQIEWLEPTEAEVLTLYTCTGFRDSKRLVIRANAIEDLSAIK